MNKIPLSVIILTFNEEENLPDAIESVKEWAHEIFVVDSLSTDRTVDIALDSGATVVQRPFKNIGDQWCWAIDNLPVSQPWILKLDADERISEPLRDEIFRITGGYAQHNGYYIRVRLWFMGRPLHVVVKTCRLWKTGKGSFSNVVINEHVQIDGPVGSLKGFIEHVDSPNLHRWFEKQNRYSTITAIQHVTGKAYSTKPNLFGSPLERQMFFKNIFYHVPFRYFFNWLHEAFVRRAILDGRAGLTWISLRTFVRKAAQYKIEEIKTTGKLPDVPPIPSGDYDPRVAASPLQKKLMGNIMDE